MGKWIPACAGMTAKARLAAKTRMIVKRALLMINKKNILPLSLPRTPWLVLCLLTSFLTACAPPPPPHAINNLCGVFQEYPDWYWATKKTQKKWGVPIGTQMAIIYQESGFQGDAKPPRKHLLWVIPWKRPTTAYGYSQALKKTWEHYEINNHRHWARRTDFSDASDFIGWYSHQLSRQTGIKVWDPYNLYLAYHEGGGGYLKKTYEKKPWLMHLAHKVKERSELYYKQLQYCANRIRTSWW